MFLSEQIVLTLRKAVSKGPGVVVVDEALSLAAPNKKKNETSIGTTMMFR